MKTKDEGLIWIIITISERWILFCLKISIDLFVLCLVLFIRFINPLVTIRIGLIDLGRIGGSYDASWNLDHQTNLPKTIDIYYFGYSTDHYNTFWKKIWEKSVTISPFSELTNQIDIFNKKFPGGDAHTANYEHWPPPKNVIKSIISSEDIIRYQFSKKEEVFGAEMLEKLGLSMEDSFVCYHVRDRAFLDKVAEYRDWSYHDFRDADIKSYLPSIDELINRDKYIVRMGVVARDSIQTYHTSCIDYAYSNIRSDFMDIFLSAKCDYFVATISGIIIIPEFFRKPMVYTNSLKISNTHSWISNSLTIFKLFYSNEEQRLLSFKEILDKGIGHLSSVNQLKSEDLTIIDNTSDEISEVVSEMECRLNGTWENVPSDIDRQKRFWSVFGNDYIKSDSARIGTMYLRKYEHLLP